MTYALAAFLRPFIAILIMAGIVIPIEMGLAKVLPDSRLKRVLFDRTFQKRRPYMFFLVWLVLISLLISFCYFVVAK